MTLKKNRTTRLFGIAVVKEQEVIVERNPRKIIVKLMEVLIMDLQELLEEELFEQVEAKLKEVDGEDVELFIAGENDGDFVRRNRLNEESDKVKELRSQLQDYDTQIEELKKHADASSELQDKIKEIQDAKKEEVETLNNKLRQKTLDNEVEKELIKRKARNPKAVKALLDNDTIKLEEDDSVIGLSEQLDKLQESDDYLFESAEARKKKKAGEDFSKGQDFSGNNESELDAMRKIAGLKK
jgi:copper chaperone CopZ